MEGLLRLLLVFISFSFSVSSYCVTGVKQCSSQTRRWEHLSSSDIPGTELAILPLGSTESHGPHLPLGTDAILAFELTTKAADELPNVVILPSSPFGASFEHVHFPGTIAIRDDTLNSFWGDVLASIVRSGVKKLLLVNAHGGQTSNVEIAARNVRFAYDVLAVNFNVQAMLAKAYSDLAESNSEEILHGIHGGLIETSVMLHVRPELVQLDQIRNFPPKPKPHSKLEPYGSIVSYGWCMKDISSAGAVGNASGSSAELGSQIFERSVMKLRTVIEDLIDSNMEEILVMG